jgi:preprotein translocase subunit SecA
VVLSKLLRAGEGKTLRRLKNIADAVNNVEEDFLAMTDAELRAETDVFRKRLRDGETVDDILVEAFAVGREAPGAPSGSGTSTSRSWAARACTWATSPRCAPARARPSPARCRPTSTPSTARASTSSRSTTTSPAATPSGWAGCTASSACRRRHPRQRAARRAPPSYGCDITYGTNNEFGFDYLRDNMAWSAEELVQRGHHFAIVDEVDSILIDEARTPLIISGPSDQATKWYSEFARIIPRLVRDVDYEVDEKKRTVGILESGVEKVEDQLGIDNLYESVNTPLVGYLQNALKAKELYRKDKEYVVIDGEVLIVDEHTGRVLAAAATARACTRPSRPRRACGSRTRTRRSPRSPCRTTSASTPSSAA